MPLSPRELGLANLTVITADVVDWAPPNGQAGKFDRVVSVEMFEHMKNYQVGRCAP